MMYNLKRKVLLSNSGVNFYYGAVNSPHVYNVITYNKFANYIEVKDDSDKYIQDIPLELIEQFLKDKHYAEQI